MTAAPALAHSIIEVIGGTPLLELHRLQQDLELDGRLLLKLDYLNPGSSKKDRIAAALIEEARAEGELAPGQPVIELTSGNAGTGLALVCRALGHPFIAVMSQGNTPERARMMRALGAHVELVPQASRAVVGQVSGQDLELVEQRTQVLARELGAFRADQFERQAGWRAHATTTGPELWQQSSGSIDAFCDFVGSGGTLAGVTAYLKTVNPNLRSYAVEPEGAAALAGEPVSRPAHAIQGGGYSRTTLTHLDGTSLDGHVVVTDDAAVATARMLARVEGVFAGFSTGANVAAAIELLRGREAGSTVACLACDSGMKYLSTDLY
jgi:cysteine synthase A